MWSIVEIVGLLDATDKSGVAFCYVNAIADEPKFDHSPAPAPCACVHRLLEPLSPFLLRPVESIRTDCVERRVGPPNRA
jgi:hypothetical protein